GFSTVFMPEQQRTPHSLGFLGPRLHWLYTRAERQKILLVERIASNASSEIAYRDQALAEVKGAADKALFDKDAELQAAREAINADADAHEEQLKTTELEHAEQSKKKEEEWVAKLAGMADSL